MTDGNIETAALRSMAADKSGTALALLMKTWSRDIVLYSTAIALDAAKEREKLRTNGIDVCRKKISGWKETLGKLERIVFEDGDRDSADWTVFQHRKRSAIDTAGSIGCT